MNLKLWGSLEATQHPTNRLNKPVTKADCSASDGNDAPTPHHTLTYYLHRNPNLDLDLLTLTPEYRQGGTQVSLFHFPTNNAVPNQPPFPVPTELCTQVRPPPLTANETAKRYWLSLL